MAVTKSRYWAFIAYPESLPDNWINFLDILGMPYAISPIHDRDTTDLGEIKKAHYHVMLVWPGPTPRSGIVSRVTDPLNQPAPIALVSPVGYYKYLWHDDEDEKVVYDKSKIICGNGFEIESYYELTQAEKRQFCVMGIQYAEEHNITSYRDLILALMNDDNWELFDYVKANTIFFNAFLNPYRGRAKHAD